MESDRESKTTKPHLNQVVTGIVLGIVFVAGILGFINAPNSNPPQSQVSEKPNHVSLQEQLPLNVQTPTTVAEKPALGPKLAFSLEDQNESLHTETEFLGAPIVFMVSDKAGSQYSKRWSKAIYEAMDARSVERVRIVPVPQLGIVPDFARGLARSMVAKDLGDMFALLDWDASFTTTYDLKDGHANYLLFNAEGRLLRKQSVQDLDDATLADLVDGIVTAIEEHAESSADEL